MSGFTIFYDKYKFELELVGTQINIKLTDTELLDFYEGSVKEADIYVKPIKKFYTMIERALCCEPNYTIIINDKKSQLVCSIAYNTEMIEIEETITFTKVTTQKTKELLLVERVKELELLLVDRVKELTEHATPVFGYGDFGERMIFDINSKVIDFRLFDNFTRYQNFSKYNMFTKAKKIIISTDSTVFCVIVDTISIFSLKSNFGCGCNHNAAMNAAVTADFSSTAISATTIATTITATKRFICLEHGSRNCGGINITPYIKCSSHFNHPSVYLPSVTEVEVYCSPLVSLEEFFTKFRSLPNLEKLSLIQRDHTGYSGAFLDIHSMITTTPNKKLKHIVLKNMSTWIKPDTVDKARLYAQVNHIRLEII